MLRSLVVLVFLGAGPLLGAVVPVRGQDRDAGWDDGSTSPYSFGRLDEDGDGRLTNGEMAKARQQFAAAVKETRASLRAAVDRDGNGKISRFESVEALPRWTGLRERARELALAAHDLDEDGKLAGAEARALQERIGRVFIAHGVKAVDADRDRNLSRAEVDAAVAAILKGEGGLFQLCDVNNDGQLTVQEIDTAFDLLVAAVGP